MGWKGFAIGSIAGGARGSWIGAIIGALAGDWVERRWFSAHRGPASGRVSPFPADDDALLRAYAELGVAPSAENEVVRAAYRELAKKHHPDAMRAAGADDAAVAAAGAKMARVNAAWSEIRDARGMK